MNLSDTVNRCPVPEVELAPSQAGRECAQAGRVEHRSAASSAIAQQQVRLARAPGAGRMRIPAVFPAILAGFKRVQNYFLGFGPDGQRRGRVQNPPSLRRGVLNPPLARSGDSTPEGSKVGYVNPILNPDLNPRGARVSGWVRQGRT